MRVILHLDEYLSFSCFMHFQYMLQFLGTEDSHVLRDISRYLCLNFF